MTFSLDNDLWVCQDCYFAHHYGATEVDGEWFAGESDIPADVDLFDNTDSETGDGIRGFSSRRCDGCSSHLGGARYRLAFDEKGSQP